MATKTGHRGLYLSGACVANGAFGLPDLGLTGLTDTLTEARRITAATDTPLLVDIDTGWGSLLSLARGIRELEAAGVAAVHLEDQVDNKRCGHRPNKVLVATSQMNDRIQAAVDARRSNDFFIMARTDAYAGEGMSGVIDRANSYIEAGADAIFADALPSAGDFKQLAENISVPLLANMTEFGCTELLSLHTLQKSGVAMALYPLSAFRMMNRAAELTYQTLNHRGDQQSLLGQMQTRDELYALLEYYQAELAMDQQAGAADDKTD